MTPFFKNILILTGIIIFIIVIQMIFTFFDISFAEYGTYLFWFIALVIFYYILPDKYPISWISN